VADVCNDVGLHLRKKTRAPFIAYGFFGVINIETIVIVKARTDYNYAEDGGRFFFRARVGSWRKLKRNLISSFNHVPDVLYKVAAVKY